MPKAVPTLLTLMATAIPLEYAAAQFPTEQARIVGNKCSPAIGEGGNLRQGKATLQGKCQGNGSTPRIVHDGKQNTYILFSVNSGNKSDRDRSELAFTSEHLPFGRDVYIGFSINIPKSSRKSYDWFYLMQFWQDEGHPPIAGLRMERGQSHAASVVFRGKDNVKGTRVATVRLTPGKWINIVMRISVNPGKRGCLTVYFNKNYGTEKCGIIGYTNASKPWYRLKFGIYKASEPDSDYVVAYRRVCIGRSLEDVWPAH